MDSGAYDEVLERTLACMLDELCLNRTKEQDDVANGALSVLHRDIKQRIKAIVNTLPPC